MDLLILLRHPASMPYHPQITTLLTDLGATQAQVVKALPPGSELKKRMRKGINDEESAASKKQKVRAVGPWRSGPCVLVIAGSF